MVIAAHLDESPVGATPASATLETGVPWLSPSIAPSEFQANI
jgi:hypothetical protein